MNANGLFHYTQSGLDNVWLVNGWRVEDTEYGPGFTIENADRLHRAIARAIVSSPRPLRGQDARFLRVMLELSQADLARLLGVDRATVIRWEKARKRALSRVQDIALRALYAARADRAALPGVAQGLRAGVARPRGPDYRRPVYRQVFQARRREWREKKAA
jgi:DNA-binding transcriptional regulator YiaG